MIRIITTRDSLAVYFFHGRTSRSTLYTVKLEVVVDETAYTDMGEDV